MLKSCKSGEHCQHYYTEDLKCCLCHSRNESSPDQLHEQLVNSLIDKNRQMISTHKQLLRALDGLEKQRVALVAQVEDIREQSNERERYVKYLESTLEKLGWNPNDKH